VIIEDVKLKQGLVELVKSGQLNPHIDTVEHPVDTGIKDWEIIINVEILIMNLVEFGVILPIEERDGNIVLLRQHQPVKKAEGLLQMDIEIYLNHKKHVYLDVVVIVDGKVLIMVVPPEGHMLIIHVKKVEVNEINNIII